MKRVKVYTLGFELTKEVPESVSEYNLLAPKRVDPCLEDAVDNVLYRCTFAQFRTALLTRLEELTGIERLNHGTEDAPEWESDARFIKRLRAACPDQSTWPAIAQECMDSASFNVADREAGPAKPKVGKKDLATAQDAIDKGQAERLADLLGRKLARPVGTDQKSLAEAIKDHRQLLMAAVEAAQAKELSEG